MSSSPTQKGGTTWGNDASSDGPDPTSVDDFVVRLVVPVEDVMLEDEENVEENGEEAESEFRHVAEDAFPVVVIVRLQKHLQDGKGAPSEVKKNIPDAPSVRAFTLVVHVGLRNVLDDGDEKFEIGQKLGESQPSHDVRRRENQAHHRVKTHGQQKSSAESGDGLLAPLVKETLDDGDESNGDGV